MEKKRTRKPTAVKPKRDGLMNTKKVENRNAGANAHNKAIDEGWHKVDGTIISDLEHYIYDYLGQQDKFDVMELLVGTDGLERGTGKNTGEVKLMTVICLRKVGKGAHVILRRENIPFNRRISTAEKLRMEVNKTAEIIIWLKEKNLNPIVHLDLNPNPEHDSFQVYSTMKGWFESMGCQVEYKPTSPAASFCADYFL